MEQKRQEEETRQWMELLLKLVEKVQENSGGDLDTGCLRTTVHQKLVPEEAFLEGRATSVCCAHGDTSLYHRCTPWQRCTWKAPG